MTLRGDPSRVSIGELRAAFEAGIVPSGRFLERLAADDRRGARALAPGFARRLRHRQRQDGMLRLERALWERGVRLVAGTDEVGMGPLAGPVVAAAVILDPDDPPEADDSKVLAKAERERLGAEIRARAVATSLGVASVDEIAELDIHQAGLLAMRRAVLGLAPAPLHVLVDARTIPDLPMPQDAHVKGDAASRSIAAASIVAKVHRDAIMATLAGQHPGYGFEHHAGYATPEHLEALRRLGPCPAHRHSWAALAEHAGQLSEDFYGLREALRACSDAAAFAAWRLDVQRRLAALGADEVRRLDTMARRRSWPGLEPAEAPGLPLG